MTGAPVVRHALLAGEAELQSALEGRLELLRRRSTAMRGLVALADEESGWISAIAHLDSVSPTGQRDAQADTADGYIWSLSGVAALDRPFALRAGSFGPVWARLQSQERLYVSGAEKPLDDETADPLTADADAAAASRGMDEPDGLPTEALEAAALDDTPSDAEIVDARASELVDQPGQVSSLSIIESAFASGEEPTGEEVLELSAHDIADVTTVGQQAAKTSGLNDEAETAPDDVRAAPSDTAIVIDLDAARKRALEYVPSQNLTEEAARKILIDLRDTEIKATFPNVRPGSGILRKTLLDRLVDEAVESIEDFRRLIPRDVQLATDKDQLTAYLDPIVQILARIR